MNAPVDAGMLQRHDGPEGLAVEVSHPVAADLADVIDWPRSSSMCPKGNRFMRRVRSWVRCCCARWARCWAMGR